MGSAAPPLVANGDIPTSCFVKIDTSGGDFYALQAAANDPIIAISYEGGNKPPLGDMNVTTLAASAGQAFRTYQHGDICLLKAGTGGWTRGNRLKSDANGAGVPVLTAGSSGLQECGAIALSNAAAGEYALVEVSLQRIYVP